MPLTELSLLSRGTLSCGWIYCCGKVGHPPASVVSDQRRCEGLLGWTQASTEPLSRERQQYGETETGTSEEGFRSDDLDKPDCR